MANNFDPSLGGPVTLQQDPHHPEFVTACIITDKVYAHCQQRECFENITIPLPEGSFDFISITFNPGEIINGSLTVSPISFRPNFSRVRFRVLITFTVRVRNTNTGAIVDIPGKLPEIQKDVVLFVPESRDEFSFEIVIETASRLLTDPIQEDSVLAFAVGTFIIIKVVGRVQLLIPEFGFCPEPPECEEFTPDEICDEFELEPFPEFFPRQFEDIPMEELMQR